MYNGKILKNGELYIGSSNVDVSNIFKSQKLNEIAKTNPLIAHADILIETLDEVESLIPDHLRDTFYKNLKTLDIKIVDDIECKYDDLVVAANYNIKENSIIINKEQIKVIQKRITKKYPDCTINDYLKRTITHELFHMASTVYNKENKSLRSGVIQKNINNVIINLSLNEGITEVLTIKTNIHENFEDITKYNHFIRLTNQLIQLIGYDYIIYSYFGNYGTERIIELLAEIDLDYIKAKKVMDTFSIVHPERKNENDILNLINFQISLLEYFEVLLKRYKKEQNYDEIDRIIKCISENTIQFNTTNKKMQKITEYPNSIIKQKFYDIMKKYSNLSKDSYQRKRKAN